ncbi:MAG TPA: hypothetical protein PKE12_15685 [Kiritimatiellia bacterium]|nr:hypothetical protein [Kiritimatiellia bacterium]
MSSLARCLLLGVLLLAGCKPRPESEPVSPAPAPDPALARTAVLFVEDHGDRAAGGLSLHASQIEGLAVALRARGLPLETLLLAADDEAPVAPAHVDVAVLVDTPVLRAAEARMLEAFVREGGVLLVIGPTPTSLSGVLGIERLGDEPIPREGVSRVRRNKAASGLALKGELDWGPLAALRWPVRERDASVVAGDDESAPVFTVNAREKGLAYALSLLPPGRMYQGWEAAPGGVAVIESIIRATSPRGLLPAPVPVRVDVAANQVAFGEGAWPARVIARVRGGETNRPSGTFTVRDAAGALVSSDALRAAPDRWRARFLTADLGALPAGAYTVEVAVPGAEPVAREVRRDSAELALRLASGLAYWLDALTLPELAAGEPLPAELMEDRALLAWALARALQEPGAPERYRYELERLLFWMRAAGPRVLSDADVPASALSAWSAALARAVEPARLQISRNLATEIQVLAEQAFQRLAASDGDDTAALGARLWPAAELFKATMIDDYRIAAEAAARAAFGRQLDRGRVPGGDVRGDFYADAQRTTFAPLQWQRGRRIGLPLGLVLLESLTEPGALKADLNTVLDRYTRGALLATAEQNPYGLIAVGLEPATPPRPRPDGRALAAPESFRALYYGNAANGANGVEDIRLALAVVALERGYVTGESALRALAAAQVNGFLGLNPAGRVLLSAEAMGVGPVGRGSDNVPVWPEDRTDSGDGYPAYIWLLALHAMLFSAPP